jgi:hypothetical protein
MGKFVLGQAGHARMPVMLIDHYLSVIESDGDPTWQAWVWGYLLTHGSPRFERRPLHAAVRVVAPDWFPRAALKAGLYCARYGKNRWRLSKWSVKQLAAWTRMTGSPPEDLAGAPRRERLPLWCPEYAVIVLAAATHDSYQIRRSVPTVPALLDRLATVSGIPHSWGPVGSRWRFTVHRAGRQRLWEVRCALLSRVREI